MVWNVALEIDPRKYDAQNVDEYNVLYNNVHCV